MLETDAHTDFVEVRFAAAPPGSPHVHVFQLKPWGPPGSPYLLLTSVDDADVGFVVVPPWVFYPDYELDLDDVTAAPPGPPGRAVASDAARWRRPSCSRSLRCVIVRKRPRSTCSGRSS